MKPLDAIEAGRQHRLIATWGITLLVLFPLLIVLGLLMRLNQGELLHLQPNTFYAIMTLHGLGMAGLLFSFSLAGLHFLVGTRYARTSINLGYFVYAGVVIGVVGLAVATLIGGFAAGWYLLYPLPFKGASWPEWSSALTFISLLILGIVWLVGCVHVVRSLSVEYGGFFRLMGWQYLGRREPDEELPPIALISVVSLVPGILAFLAGAVFLIMFLFQLFEPGLEFNVLALKNVLFFFGHTLVNITIYCCVGWVYTLFPEFTGRAWKLTRGSVIAWNATFFFIVFAYFHHLYMDFAQPISIQYAGQIVSYLSAVPATAVTIFGVIAQLYRANLKWSIVPMSFLLGAVGWAIGGVAAVVDSTIAVNKVLHNTLWVPAHFHTYMLMGVVLFILGFLYDITFPRAAKDATPKAGWAFWMFVTGACGFLLMFYLGGMNSIPRRFAEYSTMGISSAHKIGASLAALAAFFVVLVLLGILTMGVSLFAGLIRGDGMGNAPEK